MKATRYWLSWLLGAALAFPLAPAWGDQEGEEEEEAPKEWSNTGEEKEDPLEEIRRLMLEVEQRLAEILPDEDTRAKQDEIVERIDRLIEEAGGTCSSSDCASCQAQQQQQKQQQEQQSSSAEEEAKRRAEEQKQARERKEQDPSRPQNPAGDAKSRNDQQKLVDREKAQAIEALRRKGAAGGRGWGHLPPRIREAVLDASKAEFPEEHREAIEEYYRRLAEEE